MLLLGQYIKITKAFKQEENIPFGGVSQPLILHVMGQVQRVCKKQIPCCVLELLVIKKKKTERLKLFQVMENLI